MFKKSRICESNDGNEDRLSDLPDEVIVHIVSLMPTLDAVRTMLLRRFGNLWTLVPVLRFEFNEYSSEMVRIDNKPPSTHVAFSSFACFVRNVLLLYRRSTIDTFCLCAGNLGKMSKDARINCDVRMWLRYAIEREVKNLYFRYDSLSFDPPRCIFTSQSLATLALLGCQIKHYEHQSQIHLGTLRNLSLISVKGSTESYNQLISGCPSLQELNIYFDAISGFEILNINAPSVSKLRIRVLNNRCSCTLNCSSLKYLDIDVSEKSPYFQLSVIGVISLQEVIVQCLPTRYYYGEVQPFLKLFQNAEVFKLSRKVFKGECQLLCSELSTCVMPLLKTVTVHGNHGYKKWCEGQLQVIEVLLKNAVVLDKLVITLAKSKLTTVEELDLVKQVLTFRRASANATVIFA